MKVRLGQIAYARSGDKGSSANIGVIARHPGGYIALRTYLSAKIVQDYLHPLGATLVTRYELPNLEALNFVVENVLDGGASLSLRTDAQGKALGQQLLDLELDVHTFEQPQDPAITFQALRDLVERAIVDRQAKECVAYERVDHSQSVRIAAAVGLDLAHFSHVIESDAVRHVLRNHGKHSRHLRIHEVPVELSDFLLLPEIMSSFDEVILSNALTRHGTLQVLVYRKKINGYVVVAQELRLGKSRLALKTLHKKLAGPPTDELPERSSGGPAPS